MSKAQTAFMATAWMFIVLSGLLFLVPTEFDSAEGAAWATLSIGMASHLALLVAIIYDRIPAADVSADTA